MTATGKQVDFATALLFEAGYQTRFMDSSFKRLGATMSERSGTVSDWLRGMDRARISHLISMLQETLGRPRTSTRS